MGAFDMRIEMHSTSFLNVFDISDIKQVHLPSIIITKNSYGAAAAFTEECGINTKKLFSPNIA